LENRTADAVVKNLSTLGIAHLAEWDVLAFVHRHGTSLVSAEKIAALVGYAKTVVGAALESLTAKGLLKRSRNSRGARLYQSADAVPGDPLQLALEELRIVAEDRHGRLLLIKHLRQAARGKDLRERGGLHLA
jgi:predicted transcriptional regulator of viral defense system